MYITSFRKLEPTKIYKLANDNYRKRFVSKLMSEFNEYITAFKERALFVTITR